MAAGKGDDLLGPLKDEGTISGLKKKKKKKEKDGEKKYLALSQLSVFWIIPKGPVGGWHGFKVPNDTMNRGQELHNVGVNEEVRIAFRMGSLEPNIQGSNGLTREGTY